MITLAQIEALLLNATLYKPLHISHLTVEHEVIKDLCTLAKERLATPPNTMTLTNDELEALAKRLEDVQPHENVPFTCYRGAATIRHLMAENSNLASWQCPYLDGVSGLTSDDWGHQFCAKERTIRHLMARVRELEKERDKAFNEGLDVAARLLDKKPKPTMPPNAMEYFHKETFNLGQEAASNASILNIRSLKRTSEATP